MVKPVERVGVMGEEEERMRAYEEERRLMILRQLEILTNKKITENADVDNSIQLLQVFISSVTEVLSSWVIQEQLEKMPGDQSSAEQAAQQRNENNLAENFDFSSTDYDDLFRTSTEVNINDEYNIF